MSSSDNVTDYVMNCNQCLNILCHQEVSREISDLEEDILKGNNICYNKYELTDGLPPTRERMNLA